MKKEAESAFSAGEVEALLEVLEELETKVVRLLDWLGTLQDSAQYLLGIRREINQLNRHLSGENMVRRLVLGLADAQDTFKRRLQIEGGHEESVDPKQQANSSVIQDHFADLDQILASNGIEHIPVVGQIFDPNIHCAMTKVRTCCADQHNRVTEIRPGYRWGEVILRYPEVMVAKYQKPQNSKEEEDDQT